MAGAMSSSTGSCSRWPRPPPATRTSSCASATPSSTMFADTAPDGSSSPRATSSLSDTVTVQPDVVYLSDADVHRVTAPNIQGPPTLVVEVLSVPRHDLVRKRELYARFGIPEYWIVSPDADRVEVYRLAGPAYAKPDVSSRATSWLPISFPGSRSTSASCSPSDRRNCNDATGRCRTARTGPRNPYSSVRRRRRTGNVDHIGRPRHSGLRAVLVSPTRTLWLPLRS